MDVFVIEHMDVYGNQRLLGHLVESSLDVYYLDLVWTSKNGHHLSVEEPKVLTLFI